MGQVVSASLARGSMITALALAARPDEQYCSELPAIDC
jgi:hypothetical protein